MLARTFVRSCIPGGLSNLSFTPVVFVCLQLSYIQPPFSSWIADFNQWESPETANFLNGEFNDV